MISAPEIAAPVQIADSASREAAAQLQRLLDQHRTFSFLRLGDGELQLLLSHQGASEAWPEPLDLPASCEIARGSPGLSKAHAARLLRAFEQCSFIDLHGDLPYNRENLHRLRWQRSSHAVGQASSGAVGLLFTWLYHELAGYLRQHRCVICGAEASLLRELLTDPRYQRIAEPFWPAKADVAFVQPRRDGARLAEDLDGIKDDLRAAIESTGADTLFLSLGGGAKILCHELAEELGIRAIDFGSALRALTYSGSDGHAAWRAPHHPFLLRVPLDVFMAAQRRARPDLDAAALVAKAHAQLCLDLQKKELLRSHTSDANDATVFDPSPENLAAFRESMRTWRRDIAPLGRGDARAEALMREFRRWRWKKGIGWDAQLFRAGVTVKGMLRRLAGLAPK